MSDQPIGNSPQSCKLSPWWMPLLHPYPLLFIQTQLPQLKITLKHQALLCFGRALCLLPQSLNLSALGSKSVIRRLKKKPSG